MNTVNGYFVIMLVCYYTWYTNPVYIYRVQTLSWLDTTELQFEALVVINKDILMYKDGCMKR